MTTTERKNYVTLIPKKSDIVYTTIIRNLTLKEYIYARSVKCRTCHSSSCVLCDSLLKVAKLVESLGYLKLSEAYRLSFPTRSYKTEAASQCFLQMPLACVRVGIPIEGRSAWYLFPFVEGVDYDKFVAFSESLCVTKSSSSIGRPDIKALLGLAQSDRERELIRYSVFKASGSTPTAARKNFGFDNIVTLIKN